MCGAYYAGITGGWMAEREEQSGGAHSFGNMHKAED